jgi:DHA1 family multidrug resistance protein-like MFS transporter
LRKASIGRFFAVYFAYCVIANLVHPITPKFLQSIGAPDYMFGVAFATMAFAQFLTSPLWGKLGDRFGYARMAGLGLFGYSLGQYIFSLGAVFGPATVLVGRAVGGSFVAGLGVNSLAYLVTMVDDEQRRGKLLAICAAMMPLGSAIGFLVGGFIGDANMGLVFILQVTGLALAATLAWLLLGEGRRVEAATSLRWADVNPVSSTLSALRLVTFPMAVFLGAVFLTSFASSMHDQSFNYYLRAQLAFPPSGNGMFKAVVGGIGLLANSTVNMWIAQRVDNRKAISVVLAGCSAALVAMVTAGSVQLFLICAVLFYTCNAIYLPIQQVLMMKSSEGSSKGAVAALFNSSRSLGMVLGPTISGFAYTARPSLPFMAAAGAFLLSVLLSEFNRRQYTRPSREQVAGSEAC